MRPTIWMLRNLIRTIGDTATQLDVRLRGDDDDLADDPAVHVLRIELTRLGRELATWEALDQRCDALEEDVRDLEQRLYDAVPAPVVPSTFPEVASALGHAESTASPFVSGSRELEAGREAGREAERALEELDLAPPFRVADLVPDPDPPAHGGTVFLGADLASPEGDRSVDRAPDSIPPEADIRAAAGLPDPEELAATAKLHPAGYPVDDLEAPTVCMTPGCGRTAVRGARHCAEHLEIPL